ncbi:MAG: flagellar hook-length control protein FliK [Treponema sp.]|nr:flagellar hook-length control protein FliK [Treponema sp.]
MIQLSPPIQSVESPEARQSVSLSPDHDKTKKKEGPDVFAKLLAGLLQKTGKPGAECATSGGEAPASGELPALAENAGETAERFPAEGFPREALGNPDSPRGGKKLRASPLRDGETAGELVKTDAPSSTDKRRVKSRSLEQQSADGAEVALAADITAARSVPEAGGGTAEGEGVTTAQALPEDFSPDNGEEALETAALNGDNAVVSYTPAEVFDQERFREDRPGPGKLDLPGELVRDDAAGLSVEIPLAETSGSVRNTRLPGGETAERDERSRGEIRFKDRRRDRAGPEAGDIRSGLDKRDKAESLRSLAEAGKGEEASTGKGTEQNSREQSSTELTVELRSLGKTQSEISAERENRPMQSYQNTLARELHENLNGDIVRHASVMLRNSGEGTIRLSLRPETLGSVKIRLEIAENKITGRIIVESGDAFKAFEQELHSLEQSFRDSGFDGASLEMAFASDGREGRQGREGEADSLFSGRRAALSYDDALSVLLENPEEGQWLGVRLDSQGRPLVNMLV